MVNRTNSLPPVCVECSTIKLGGRGEAGVDVGNVENGLCPFPSVGHFRNMGEKKRTRLLISQPFLVPTLANQKVVILIKSLLCSVSEQPCYFFSKVQNMH